MKKHFLTIVLASLFAFGAYAVPAMRITKEVKQPDGTVVTLYLQGDEYCGGFFTADGYAAGINADGHAVYSTASGNTDILIHNEKLRTQQETDFLAKEGQKTTLQEMTKQLPADRAAERMAIRRKVGGQSAQITENGTLNIATGETQVPHKGSPHIPIILADYTDIKFRDGSGALATFENFFNKAAKSAYQYFHDASSGQFTPQFHLIGPVSLPQNRKYYGEHVSQNLPDRNIYQMVTDACKLADPDIDFSIFDNDGDGVCDVVIILYAGVGQATSGVEDSVWPCQGTLTGINAITCDGTKMSKFAVFNEVNSDKRTIAGVGTFCHEFSHCLGLPDIYDINYTGTFGMKKWSLMDSGCYNDDGNTPVGYSAYEKAFMGWFEPVVAQANTFYTLPVQNTSATDKPEAVAVVNKNNTDEYYILENRKRQGWDAYSEADGMMITHINFVSGVWSSNAVNTGGNNFITIIPADNRRDEESYSGDLWPYGSQNALTNSTNPAASTYTGNFMNQPITEISIDPANDQVSFWVSKKSTFDLEEPEFASEADTSKGGAFTAYWNQTEGADEYMLQTWLTNSLANTPQDWVLPKKGLEGWTANAGIKNYASAGYCVVGNANVTGLLTSEANLEEDNGSLTAMVSARKYGTVSGAQIIVTLSDEDGKEIDKSTFTVNNKNDEYFPVCFTGLTSEKKYQISIGNIEVNKRVMLTGVLVFDGDVSNIGDEQLQAAVEFADNYEAPAADSDISQAEAAATSGTKSSMTRSGRVTMRGITDNSCTVSGLSEGEYSYRVKGVSGSGSSRLESAWSETKSVKVAAAAPSGVEAIASDTADFRIEGRTIYASGKSSLYTPSGIKISASADGCYKVTPGIYILGLGTKSAKIIIR